MSDPLPVWMPFNRDGRHRHRLEQVRALATGCHRLDATTRLAEFPVVRPADRQLPGPVKNSPVLQCVGGQGDVMDVKSAGIFPAAGPVVPAQFVRGLWFNVSFHKD